jgi:FkbM family methyltransferase
MARADAEAAIRLRTQTVPLGDGVILARVLGRYKMYLYTSDRGFAAHVMMDGYWESWLSLFFMRQIKPGMAVIDVGANFGYYTCLFADATGAKGRVLAIEPAPATARLLRDTVQLNGFAGYTHVEEAACGDSESEIAIYIPENEPKNASVFNMPGTKPTLVRQTTLDIMCAAWPRVDMIKIDAEGAEEAIFAGMQEIWKKHRPQLIIEFNAGRYANPRAFLEQLSAGRRMTEVGFDGNAKSITIDQILQRQPIDDWLLQIA